MRTMNDPKTIERAIAATGMSIGEFERLHGFYERRLIWQMIHRWGGGRGGPRFQLVARILGLCGWSIRFEGKWVHPTYFATLAKARLQSTDASLTDLSRRLGIERSSIGKWLQGKHDLRLRNGERIMRSLRAEWVKPQSMNGCHERRPVIVHRLHEPR